MSEDEPGAAGFIAHLARELGQPLTSIVNDGGASTLVRQAAGTPPDAPLEQEAGDLGIRRARYSIRDRGVANRSPGSVKDDPEVTDAIRVLPLVVRPRKAIGPSAGNRQEYAGGNSDGRSSYGDRRRHIREGFATGPADDAPEAARGPVWPVESGVRERLDSLDPERLEALALEMLEAQSLQELGLED